jgi:hypothetical protein
MIQKERQTQPISRQKESQDPMKRLLASLPRPTLAALLLLPTLLLVDALCYQVTLPVLIDLQHGTGQFSAGSTRVTLGKLGDVQSLQFVASDPLVHEYQIDGSDSTNNLNLDTGYLSGIAGSPYYRLQAWMRDLDGTSRWRDLRIQADGHLLRQVDQPANGAHFSLPLAAHLSISLQIQRPETPLSLILVQHNRRAVEITLDRNNRALTVSDADSGQIIASAFFPLDVAPFAAMVVDTLTRISLWAIVLLLAVQIGERAISSARASLRQIRRQRASSAITPEACISLLARPAYTAFLPSMGSRDTTDLHMRSGGWERPVFSLSRFPRVLSRLVIRMTPRLQALHPSAYCALACSLVYVLWIALGEYQGEPHIYDASAYVFAAKTLAQGHLTAPAPPLSQLFPGPFMVIFNGRWFAQYEPGTALTLVPGFCLHMPWLVEPLLGTLALLGSGLIAARLYNRRVATLAIVLGCLSPFYSYLAASYLSHAIALFYLVWGWWALLRFVQKGAGWNLILCAVCFGMAALTRDLVALLFLAILLPGTVLVGRTSVISRLWQRRLWWLSLLGFGLLFLALYLGYNLLLTGNARTTPRTLFFAGDVWGFGQGIGFYGQHTLAAGFVNMDEILTSLQIDLFGWPFSFTLAFCAIPFLSGRAHKADWFLLLALVLTAGSYLGYFYHGIYLGPRYLFEDLPFLLLLSARGILLLSAWGVQNARGAARWLADAREPARGSPVTLAIVGALLLCNLIYYLPRQATLYHNFTGLPGTAHLATTQLYHPLLHHALVVTDDLALYQMILFPLNDPLLQGEIIYAWGYTSEQFALLRQAFPGRALYLLVVGSDGSVHYLPLVP